MSKKLYKISSERKISGVCAGLAEYLNSDVTLIRIITLMLIIFAAPPTFLIVYITCAFIMPDKNQVF